ncbi:MAG: FkbM family methyltransferase, partial [Pseudomonadota bacterium]
ASALRVRLFRQIAAKGLRPKHIIDVGAHRGAWSRDAAGVFPDVAITLIEPQEEMTEHLERFCAEHANATWIRAGAGDAKTELPLTLAGRLDGRTLTISEDDAQARGLEQRTVSVVTLDDVVAESGHPEPEIVKIDAEGMDLQVIQGAKSLLGKTELFFLELPLFDQPGQSWHSIIAFMREQGYEPFDITDLNRRKSDDALGLIEMAFAKKAGLLRDHHGW